MIKFVVWILARDKAVSEKWYRLFSREHFEVKPQQNHENHFLADF